MSKSAARKTTVRKQEGTVVLTVLAQQYGLRVEDLMARGYSRHQIIVEKPKR